MREAAFWSQLLHNTGHYKPGNAFSYSLNLRDFFSSWINKSLWG